MTELSSLICLATPGGGLVVNVSPFQAGSFSSAGGSIAMAAAGTWYVGVDLFSGAVIALPRLGHRGWVPVAKVVATMTDVTSITQIAPRLPVSRLPRTIRKLNGGEGLNVLVMGSSLAEGGARTDDWSGMLFYSSSLTANYRLPGTITFRNIALGGMPNQYQLAQLGLGSATYALDYDSSGWSSLLGGSKGPPNGRSTMFSDVDLVVITTLANGGDYRLACIEPIIRRLREMNIEVVLTTDNPSGYPFADYASLAVADLYKDGPEVMRIADAYGVELADTAAYVGDAQFRHPGAIYRDTIHMAYGLSGSRTGPPAGGYEVWARAIRSLIHIDGNGVQTVQREFESQRLPQCRLVTDYKTPGDMVVILPADERHVALASNHGTLSAHPDGANSFARRFNSQTDVSKDLLTLTTGQRAAIAAHGMVGAAMIVWSINGDAGCTFDVYRQNVFQKTINISAQTITREVFQSIYTPTELGISVPSPAQRAVDIRVTAGTLRIAALLAHTADQEYVQPEATTRIGTWIGRVLGGLPNMPRYATDTLNDYALFKCPPSARRVTWIVSSKPNSKVLDTWSGRTSLAAQPSDGVNHIKTPGGHIGPSEMHGIRLAAANGAVDQSTNGYGLHIGGIIVTNDR